MQVIIKLISSDYLMLTRIIKNKEQKDRSRVFSTKEICIFFTNRYKGVSTYRTLETADNEVRHSQKQEEHKQHPNEARLKIYDIKKEWSNLDASQVLDLLLQELGLSVADHDDFERVFREFSDFNINSDREESKHEDEKWWIKTKKYERIPDAQKLVMVEDYLKNNLTIAQLARKYYQKYSTVCSMIQKYKSTDANHILWFK